ncbi:outer membrane beta-barrel protein [uncultured Paracoccus sp.]|uniref:outer membrane protein n=1 Tax=uncultured Paracoccus sp. TaxID=189685 RepID=UPI0025ECECD4|nr:outer membrane beta-barrel protein [uncultured Paracoccus sp.]
MTFKLALAAAGALMTAQAAAAGGYVAPVVAPVAAPVVVNPAPAIDWEGAYAGLVVGHGSGREDVGVGIGNEATLFGPDDLEISGTTYGLRAGYRQRFFTRSLAGVELSYETGSMEDSFSTAGYDASDELDHALSLRIKSGVLAGDKTWIYGLVGVSRGKFDYLLTGDGAGGPIQIDDSFTATGRILGLGLEHKITAKLSISGEWEYVNYGKTHLEDAEGKSTEATPDWHAIKLGLNYQF